MDTTILKELGKTLVCIGHTLDRCKASRKTLEGIVSLKTANGTNSLADAAQELAEQLHKGLEELAAQVQAATAIADSISASALTTILDRG